MKSQKIESMPAAIIVEDLIRLTNNVKVVPQAFSESLSGAVDADRHLNPMTEREPTRFETLIEGKPPDTYGSSVTSLADDGIVDWKRDFRELRLNLRVDDEFEFKNFYLDNMELAPDLHLIHSDLVTFYGESVQLSSTIVRSADGQDELMIYVLVGGCLDTALSRLEEFRQLYWVNDESRLYSPVTIYLLCS